MAEFLDMLRAEISAIEAELQRDSRFLKLQSLKSVLDLYDQNGSIKQNSNVMTDGRPQIGQRSPGRAPSESRSNAMELAKLLLRNRHGPVPTRDIFEHITLNGGEIGGKDPVSNLSAMLSNSEEFQSNGRAGWTLASENNATLMGEDAYRSVSEAVLAQLTNSQIQDALKGIKESSKIPAEIDGRLLGYAREQIGRYLTDKETNSLRRVFTNLIERYIL